MLLAGTPEFLLFCLVLMRMSGFIFFNPVFGRTSIPGLYRAGLTLLMAIVVFPMAGEVETVAVTTPLVFTMLLIKELAVGFVVGMVMRIFEMVPMVAGTVIDSQIGLAMAATYDPQSGTQVALTANILRTFYLLLFFAVDGHMALFYIIMTSQEIVPYGAVAFGPEVSQAMLTIFVQCFALAAKLAMPIIAYEFLVDIGVGLLMRIIPQINLFILSIQLRVLIGITMLVFLVYPVSDFLNGVTTDMVSSVQEMLTVLSGG